MLKVYFILVVFSSLLFSTSIDDIKKSMLLNYMEQTHNTKVIQQENEEIIRQNTIYYQNIIEKSREYFSGFVSKKWGKENIKFSTIKTFTQYSDDMNSRESVNFEKGEVTFEVVVDVDKNVDPEVFEKKLANLKKQNMKDTLDKDPVAKLSNQYLSKKKITENIKLEEETKGFIKGLIEKKKIDKDIIKEKVVNLENGEKKKIVSVKVKMVPKHLELRANRYKDTVFKEAKRFNIKPSHIFATIQAESYFNPLAISHIPAYGLMQIVPSTAGKDAYYALKGKKVLLPPPYLYNAKKNIELGTQYIQIIKKRYLKGIKNTSSLFYCSATAYNAGIGTLIKSFTGSYSKRKEAIAKINSMTPEQVYNHLRTSKRLTKEAKNYVKKIKNNSSNYYKWDNI